MSLHETALQLLREVHVDNTGDIENWHLHVIIGNDNVEDHWILYYLELLETGKKREQIADTNHPEVIKQAQLLKLMKEMSIKERLRLICNYYGNNMSEEMLDEMIRDDYTDEGD